MSEKKKKTTSSAVAPAEKKESTKKAKSSKSAKQPTVSSESKVGQSDKSQTPIKSDDTGSLDFEAGILFNRFDTAKAGVLTADEFRKMWRDSKELQNKQSLPSGRNGGDNDPSLSFEAGQIFSSFDKDNDGRLNKSEFETLIKTHPELLKSGILQSPNSNVIKENTYPFELITGRLLTHYDETAGIAIPNTAVEQHKNMGNTVIPLIESYRARYDKLRSLLTTKLLPRREHLLQLRRQLQNTSAEVLAVRKGIERETMTDMEQILERLRATESMRQSAIMHQVLQIEEELESIERMVRRVELANDDSINAYASTGVLLTSAVPGRTPIESVRVPRAASMVELIQQYGDLSSQIDRQSVKPLTVQIDFPVDDFPRETSERLDIIARCDRYVHALSVKDHMLWTAIQEKDHAEELLAEEQRLSHEYAKEIASWAEMSHKLANDLKSSKNDNDLLDRRNKELIEILRRNNLYYVISNSKD